MAKFKVGKALRNCIYPYPVYVAVFADGSEQRMGFWSKRGKAFDFDRGRRICEFVGRRGAVVDGYVEQDQTLTHDPKFSLEPVKSAPVKRASYKKLLAELVAAIDDRVNNDDALTMARAALA